MWSKLDDALFDHHKLIHAGDLIGGPYGLAAALGFYVAGILYSNKHLTDGFLPERVVRRWPHARHPDALAAALVKAGLWDEVGGGWRIHDYLDYQPSREEVEDQREKRRASGRLGGQRSGQVRRVKTKRDASTETKHDASTMSNPVPSRPVPYDRVTDVTRSPRARDAALIERKNPRIQNLGDPVPLWDWQFSKFRDALRPQFGDEAYAQTLAWMTRVGEVLLTAGERVDVSDPVKFWDEQYRRDWAPAADPMAAFRRLGKA